MCGTTDGKALFPDKDISGIDTEKIHYIYMVWNHLKLKKPMGREGLFIIDQGLWKGYLN